MIAPKAKFGSKTDSAYYNGKLDETALIYNSCVKIYPEAILRTAILPPSYSSSKKTLMKYENAMDTSPKRKSDRKISP